MVYRPLRSGFNKETPKMDEPVARIRIELQDSEPKIWRRVDVPLSATLLSLHDIIQVTMGWRGDHLFEFVIGDKVYAEPHPDDEMYERRVYQAKSIRLQALIARGVNRLLYVYDFGDYWRHDVTLEALRDGSPDVDYPAFVDGARRGPPEDVGGSTGFMEFLDAVLDPRHEDHERMLEWYGRPFDPDDIDERRIRSVLSMFADRRKGPLASHRSGGRAKAPSHRI
jgi:hypothetical protein